MYVIEKVGKLILVVKESRFCLAIAFGEILEQFRPLFMALKSCLLFKKKC